MTKKVLIKVLSFITAAMFSLTTFGQVTTSSLNGRVVDDSGEALAGAVVSVLHVPSGSQYYGLVNADGRYSIEGLKPGQDYVIEVSFIGFRYMFN